MRRIFPSLAVLIGFSVLGALSGCATSAPSQSTAVPATSAKHEFNPATQRYEASGPYGSRENRSSSGSSARP